ncbi:hypothetical protein H0H87_012341 [Tephrocybe sp. NHM501043]|nr:hypothetical protein H0H87_012341 [Tephrocybe sp. NHM501043]
MKPKDRQHQTPQLLFDISRDPSDPSLGGIRIMGQEGLEESLDQYLHMELSPKIRFTMLRIKCDARVLDRWDLLIERPNGIRIIDVFEEIYKAYNVPLTDAESEYFKFPLLSTMCYGAYRRRAKYGPAPEEKILNQGMCRVDLMQDKIFFGGFSFDNTYGQYHFHLEHLTEILSYQNRS